MFALVLVFKELLETYRCLVLKLHALTLKFFLLEKEQIINVTAQILSSWIFVSSFHSLAFFISLSMVLFFLFLTHEDAEKIMCKRIFHVLELAWRQSLHLCWVRRGSALSAKMIVECCSRLPRFESFVYLYIPSQAVNCSHQVTLGY